MAKKKKPIEKSTRRTHVLAFAYDGMSILTSSSSPNLRILRLLNFKITPCTTKKKGIRRRRRRY